MVQFFLRVADRGAPWHDSLAPWRVARFRLRMLKPLSTLTEPDERFRSLVHLDAASGEQRPMGIADLYGMMEPLELHPGVPAEVRLQFDTARHAFVYSWFCYDLATLAEAHAYGALENGLRLRAEAAHATPERPGMKGLLRLAVQQAWLPEADFGHLVDILPMMRNHLQHGQPNLNPSGSADMLQVCRDALNGLFARPGG